MSNILDLIESTETLLAQAEANLVVLKSMGDNEKGAAAKILPLLNRYEEVEQLMKERKKEFLSLLIRFAILSKKRKYLIGDGNFTYEVCPSGKIYVSNKDIAPYNGSGDLRGTWSVELFVAKKGFRYGDFCKQIIAATKQFLTEHPEVQKKGVRELKDLMDQLCEFTDKS